MMLVMKNLIEATKVVHKFFCYAKVDDTDDNYESTCNFETNFTNILLPTFCVTSMKNDDEFLIEEVVKD